MDGYAFISYAREDIDRVRPLVDHISGENINVIWDQNITPGKRFRDAIDTGLKKASCVLVVWTNHSVVSDWVRSEVDVPMRRGILVPALLDAGAEIPRPYSELNHVDLFQWKDHTSAEFKRLLSPLRQLCAREMTDSTYFTTLVDDSSALDHATNMTSEINHQVSRIKALNEVLLPDNRVVGYIRSTLEEVDKTYRAVMDAIKRFVRPAVGTETVVPDPFIEFEGGVLKADIEKGRGHCNKIEALYQRGGGLRDWLEPRLDDPRLLDANEAFRRFSAADGDMFYALAQIGDVLTNESIVIVNLLIAAQEEAARERIIEGRHRLLPLQAAVNEARRQLGEIQTSLGHA